MYYNIFPVVMELNTETMGVADAKGKIQKAHNNKIQ